MGLLRVEDGAALIAADAGFTVIATDVLTVGIDDVEVVVAMGVLE